MEFKNSVLADQILVLYGGYEEAEISYKSGSNIYNTCLELGYDALLVDIQWVELGEFVSAFKKPFVINMVHGRYGEDGDLHQLLEDRKIPFFGNSSKTLNVTFNKLLFREVNSSIRMPKAQILRSLEYKALDIKFPHIVKLPTCGSTIGVHYIDSPESKSVLLSEWFDGVRLVEEFLDGVEGATAVYKGEFINGVIVNYPGPIFDYDTKYTPSLSKVEPWDRLPLSIRDEIIKASLDIYRECGCSGFLCVDFRLKDGIPYILEANGIPGMTKTSLVPYSFARNGIDLKALVTLMVSDGKEMAKASPTRVPVGQNLA